MWTYDVWCSFDAASTLFCACRWSDWGEAHTLFLVFCNTESLCVFSLLRTTQHALPLETLTPASSLVSAPMYLHCQRLHSRKHNAPYVFTVRVVFLELQRDVHAGAHVDQVGERTGPHCVSVTSMKGWLTLVYTALNRETGFRHKGRNAYCVGMLSLNEM